MTNERFESLISKTNRAEVNLQEARVNIGTSALDRGAGRRLNLATIKDPLRLAKATLEVGQIRRRIDRILPVLKSRKQALEEIVPTLTALQQGLADHVIEQEEYDRVYLALFGQAVPSISKPKEPAAIPTKEKEGRVRLIIDLKEHNGRHRVINAANPGLIVQLNGARWAVFNRLAQKNDEEVSTNELAKLVSGAGSRSKTPVRDTIKTLKRSLALIQAEITIVTGHDQAYAYSLNADVEIIGASERSPLELPLLKVDRSKKQVASDVRNAVITGSLEWEVFDLLAQNSNQEITTSKIKEIMKQSGYESSVGEVIYHLRQKLEADPKDPKLLTTRVLRQGLNIDAYYKLNAKVEFVQELGAQNVNIEPASITPGQEQKDLRELIEIKLPDGQVVASRGTYGKILARVATSSKDNPIESLQLVMIAYGKDTDRTRRDVSSAVSRLNKDRLEKIGWQIIQPVSSGQRAQGQKAFYYLEAAEPKQSVDEIPKTATVPEEEKPQQYSLETLKAELADTEENIAMIHLSAESETDSMSHIFREELKYAQNYAAELRNRIAQLSPNAAVESVTLPDGQIFARGENKNAIVKRIFQATTDSPVSYEELARVVYDSEDAKVRSSISAQIFQLGPMLEPLGWQLIKDHVGEGKHKRIVIFPKKIQIEVPVTPTATGRGIFEGEEMQVVPYEPGSGGERTPEETKVLDSIVSGLTRNSRLWYDRLHREVAPRDGLEITLVSPQELYSIFIRALEKMVVESQVTALRNHWTEKEKNLWEKIDYKLKDQANNNLATFKRLIDDELKRSQREFLGLNPGATSISI